METIDLIHSLASDVKPARKLWKLPTRILVWGVCSLMVVCLWILAFGTRPDLFSKVREIRFLSEALLLLIGGIGAAIASLVFSRPDSGRSKVVKGGSFLPLGIWVTFLLSLVLDAYLHQSESLIAGGGLGCIRDILLIGFIPATILLALVSKANPTELGLTGSLILVSMACLGAFATQLLCKNDGVFHVFVWHCLPVITLTFIGIPIGRRLLRW